METKSVLTASIGELVDGVLARLAEDDDDEREYLRQLCSPEAQRVLERMGVEMLHMLDVIPGVEETAMSVNVVGLSQATGVPKGTVSKRLQHLVDAGAVTRHRLPDNRKEVHLRLTSVGAEIRAAHRSLHDHLGDVLGQFLGRYSTDELHVVERVLHDLLRMPRDGLRFRPDLLD